MTVSVVSYSHGRWWLDGMTVSVGQLQPKQVVVGWHIGMTVSVGQLQPQQVVIGWHDSVGWWLDGVAVSVGQLPQHVGGLA